MRISVILILLASALSLTSAAGHAAIRATSPAQMAKVENPDSEMKCLEAFVNSKFEYAHGLCLTLAQQGMADAQLVTGLMYALGEGTKKDTGRAKLWLNEALRNGSQEARDALIDLNLAD